MFMRIILNNIDSSHRSMDNRQSVKMSSDMQSISEFSIGEKAKIAGFNTCPRHYRHKLLVMGLTPGQIIEIVRVAPLGDPVQILTRGFVLTLRKAEAKALQLLKVK